MIKVEKIGNVKLDYSEYDGSDLYSDGSVEDDILDMVKNEWNYNQMIKEDGRFAILYHLAKDRENIVTAMNISKDDTVLEIGSGCGAVTGALTRRAKRVECVELSKRRSLINAYRNKECDNLCIKVANFQNLSLEPIYDVVTLIGVLEYAVYYIGGDNPFVDLLKKVKKILKPGGRIYIAIENRLGLKYFAGAKEDHIGVEFVGIEGYDEKSHVRTFSKNQLTDMIRKSGFEEVEFYYPFPDYKFPKVIYRDSMTPQINEVSTIYSNYGGMRNLYFDEVKAMRVLLETDDWKTFSNSFLVEVTNC